MKLTYYLAISSMDISFFRFENELIIALGKGEPALVMSEYGFK